MIGIKNKPKGPVLNASRSTRLQFMGGVRGLLALSLMLAFAVSGALVPVHAAQLPPTNSSANESSSSFPVSPLTINDSNIEAMMLLYSHLVIDFWEPRCLPCVFMNDTIDAIAKDMNGKVAFGMLNIYQNPISMEKYRITRTPTLILFKKGAIVYEFIGYVDNSTLENRILSHL
jgi:thioredoxin 1